MILNGCEFSALRVIAQRSRTAPRASAPICSFHSSFPVPRLTFADDGTLISGLQAFDAWHEDLGLTDSNPRSSALIGLLNAAGPISGFFIGPVIQYIDDRWGRRWGIRFYGYNILVGTAISCAAGVSGTKGNSGYAVFVVGRFIIGFGLAAFLMTSLAVVQEITHPRSRQRVASSWNSYYILGMVVASWVNFGSSYLKNSWGWRLPYILQLPFALYILIAVQFVPETPRFLLSKGRDADALRFLADYHGDGNASDPLVVFEFDEMKEAIVAERHAKAEKWSTILRSRPNRHRLGLALLMTFVTQMAGASIIYFYYSMVFDSVGITDPSVQTGIAAGLNMFTWLCQIGSVMTERFFGKKRILLWCWPLLLLCFVGLTVAGAQFAKSDQQDHKSAIATVVLVWIYLGVYNVACPIIYSYPAEVQTYSMRTKGLLVWNQATQVQGTYVTFVDSIAFNKIGYWYYIVYMPLIVIQWVLMKRYMVETNGYTLEEIALAFDSWEHLPFTGHAQPAGEAEAGKAALGDGGSDKGDRKSGDGVDVTTK